MVINEWLMTIYRSLTMKTLFEASLFWMEVVIQQEGNSCSTKVATLFKSYWKVWMHRAGWVDMGPEKAIWPCTYIALLYFLRMWIEIMAFNLN